MAGPPTSPATPGAGNAADAADPCVVDEQRHIPTLRSGRTDLGGVGDIEFDGDHARQRHLRRIACRGIDLGGTEGQRLLGELESKTAIGARHEYDGTLNLHDVSFRAEAHRLNMTSII